VSNLNSISLENDAFVNNTESEIARILRRAADRVENGVGSGVLMDSNGNKVGDFNTF